RRGGAHRRSALPGAPPDAGRGPPLLRMGPCRNGQAREVLPPDGPGARAAGDGSRGLAPLRGRGGPGARARVRAARGELTPGHGDAAMRGIRRVFRLPHPGRSGAGREVDEELAFHLERVASELEAEGWDPA